jgi:hypothetical protein
MEGAKSQSCTYQFGSILEVAETSRVMKKSFELVPINVVFQFCEQSCYEMSGEDHLRLESA